MRRLTLLLSVVLLLAPVVRAANDFSDDSNCKALWRFESGALTTDSKGTNTLTDTSGTGSVTASATHQEGDYSADFEESSTQEFTIADGSLDTGFPLKNGDTNKKISVCCWVRFESLPGPGESRYVWSKYDTVAGTRSLALAVYNGAGNIEFTLYQGHTTGGDGEYESDLYEAANPSTATWYHVAVTYDDSTKGSRIRVVDSGGTMLGGGPDATHTFTNAINVEDADWVIGSRSNSAATTFHDGLIDEMVVFDDVLSVGEIDAIRNGTYGSHESEPFDPGFDPGFE